MRSIVACTLFLLVIAAACGGSQPPSVSEGTRLLVDDAQQAERDRRYDRARELLERAVREAPDRPSAAFAVRQLASALLFWGEYEDARVALVSLTQVAPESPSAHHDLGIVRARLGDEAGAEQSLLRACELAPADARPRIALAALYVNQRRFHEAEPIYREILTLDIPEKLRRAVERGLELIAEEKRSG